MVIEESVRCEGAEAQPSEGADEEVDIDDDLEFDVNVREDQEEAVQIFEFLRNSDRAVKNHEVEYSVQPSESPPMQLPPNYITFRASNSEDDEKAAEYDIDCQDMLFINRINKLRASGQIDPISHEQFEVLMDELEKNSFFKKLGTRKDDDPDAACCVCMDGETDDQNQIIFCDLCNIPVHQDCYGVPYVPAGEWYCRRCTLSPSVTVKCILCGRAGGAFKQTPDGDWVHVICTIWINETCFGNPVFMEPVHNTEKAIEVRKNLKCVVCREKMGACIQCSFGTCARAFHVACGVRADFEMTTEEVDENSDVVVRRAYCPEHCSSQEVRERTKKMLLRKKGLQFNLKPEEDEVCTISEADIAQENVDAIARKLRIPFIDHFVGYWRFKREQKHGMPLLRSLQKAMKQMIEKSKLETSATEPFEDTNAQREVEWGRSVKDEVVERRVPYQPKPKPKHVQMDIDPEYELVKRQLRYMRQGADQVRRRENMKHDLILLKMKIFIENCKPVRSIFQSTLDELVELDDGEVFTQPVSEDDVPGYRSVIKKPMDLSRMRSKLEQGEYTNCSQFVADFKRMISNCKFFNQLNEFYLNYACNYEKECKPILEKLQLARETPDSNAEVLQEMNPCPPPLEDVEPEMVRVRTPSRKSVKTRRTPSRSVHKRIRRASPEIAVLKTMKKTSKHDAGGLIQSSLLKFFSRDLSYVATPENDENGSPGSPGTPKRRSRRIPN